MVYYEALRQNERVMEKEESHNYTATSNLSLIIKHNLTAQNLHNHLATCHLPSPTLTSFLPLGLGHHREEMACLPSRLERNGSELSLGRKQALPSAARKMFGEPQSQVQRHAFQQYIASALYFLGQSDSLLLANE